jgi:hypothetical protein
MTRAFLILVLCILVIPSMAAADPLPSVPDVEDVLAELTALAQAQVDAAMAQFYNETALLGSLAEWGLNQTGINGTQEPQAAIHCIYPNHPGPCIYCAKVSSTFDAWHLSLPGSVTYSLPAKSVIMVYPGPGGIPGHLGVAVGMHTTKIQIVRQLECP